MIIQKAAAALFGAACLLSLAACQGKPAAPVVMAPFANVAIPPKSRILVTETLSANFGTNKALLETSLRQSAEACQAAVDFFEFPHAGGELALDRPMADTQADFTRKTLSFQPDLILDLRSTGWKGPGGMSGQLVSGSFNFALRLLDGKKRNELWQSTATVNVPSGSGASLAQELIRVLTLTGALPHCPPATPSR